MKVFQLSLTARLHVSKEVLASCLNRENFRHPTKLLKGTSCYSIVAFSFFFFQKKKIIILPPTQLFLERKFLIGKWLVTKENGARNAVGLKEEKKKVFSFYLFLSENFNRISSKESAGIVNRDGTRGMQKSKISKEVQFIFSNGWKTSFLDWRNKQENKISFFGIFKIYARLGNFKKRMGAFFLFA